MDFLQNLALASGLAWGAGVRLYATIFIAGLLARLGYVHLPADLAVLSSDWVLWTSGILTLGDFIADKSPGFDSFWDGVHTFARVPAGIFLAWGAAGDQGPAIQFACALLGGAVVSGTHLAKSSARLAINHSPEPFSNWVTSFAEDGVWLSAMWLMIGHPLVFLALLAVFMALVVWTLPKLWRLVAGWWRRGPSATGSAPAVAG
jgi:hypothetical protein